MNYYHGNKDDPQDYKHLFSHSFDVNHSSESSSMPTYFYDNNHMELFDNNDMDFLNMNQNDFVLTDNLDPSIFLEANRNDNSLDLETQQAILFSDPTFLRQQQLLQEEQQKLPMRSNLSAMLDNNKIEPIHLVSSQQQKKDILDKTMTGKVTKPIPISSSLPSIDHQRRFNELQARFRINYAKKPTTSKPVLGTSMPTTSSLHTDSGNRRLSLEPPSSSSSSSSSSSKSVLKLNGGKLKSTNNEVMASSFPSRTMPIQIQRVHRANGFQNHDLEQRQKKLDDQLVKTDFDDITVSELKELLRQRGKPATGKKAILLQRLIEERDLIQHARAKNIPILNRYTLQSPVISSPSSLPESMYLSSSPNNNNMMGSLNRSIADMHIGSPPISNQQSRRFAPYSTSPRTSATSIYSSSVPTISLDTMMMQQEPARVRNIKKSYAPFTSSALATPDREDDINPFDTVKEEAQQDILSQELTPNDMEWTDPTLDFMTQNGTHMNQSTEELLSFFANQGSFTDIDFNINGPDLSSVMYDDINNI